MRKDQLNVSIEEFAGGAVSQLFEDGIKKIIENVDDPNRPWKDKRKLILGFEVAPNERRDTVSVKITQELKLAKPKPAETTMFIAVDADGSVAANEAERPEQMAMFGNDEPARGSSVVKLTQGKE